MKGQIHEQETQNSNFCDGTELFEFKRAIEELDIDDHCLALFEAFEAQLISRPVFVKLLVIAGNRLTLFTVAVAKTRNNEKKQLAIRGHVAMRKLMKLLTPEEVNTFNEKFGDFVFR